MPWNPLARSDPSEADGGPNNPDAESGTDLNRQPSYSRGGGEIHSHNLHDSSAFSNQPSRRNRKRCMIETGIVATCAIALVIGLSVHYGQQKSAVSGDLWSDEPVETEPAQNDNAEQPGFKEPDHDHNMDDGKESAQDEGPLPGMPPGADSASNLRPGLAGAQNVDCNEYQNQVALSLNPAVSMSYVVNAADGDTNVELTPDEIAAGGTLSAEITYGGDGWIGFAHSTLGRMIGSKSVIGLPGEANGPRNPGKYDLNSHDATVGINLIDDEFQTLINATIVQENGVTTLTFTKLLSEFGEVQLVPNTTATFLWAVGTSNDLVYHGFTNKGSFELFLEPCSSTPGTTQDVAAPGVVIGPADNMTAEDLLRGEEIKMALNSYTTIHVLDDRTTPQHRAYEWISYGDPLRLTEQNATFRQRYVLATLFYATAASGNATGSPVLPDWLQGSSECSWSGIFCGGEFVKNDDQTFGLFLDDGTGQFSDATGGDKGEGDRGGSPNADEERANNNSNNNNKSGSNETGTQDASKDERPVVVIDLGGLSLSGVVPDEIGALLSLESFDMSFNDLGGPMPVTFGLLENLVILRLNNNRLEGPIPGTIGDLKSLEELYLHNNRFSGRIPQALGGVTALKAAHLNNNSLDGNIPESIGGLIELRELEFGYNNLSGAVPLPICNLALADFGVDYQHSLPQVECSCCVGDEEEQPSSPAPPPPSDGNGTKIGAEPGNGTSDEEAVSPASTWSQIGSDVFGTSDGDLFGSQVSMSADGMRFAVRSVEYETGGFGSSTEAASLGVISVYEYLIAAGSNASSGVWTQAGLAIEVDSVHFYISLSGDGGRLAVGSASQDSFDGVVRVYEFQEGGDEWAQLGGNITSDYAYSLVGPLSLSNDGNRVAVGSPLFEGDKGRVDVYNYASGSWTMVGVGVEGGDAGANFGSSVSLSGSGNIVAVGGPTSPVNDATGGAVSIYRIDEDWAKQGSDIVSEDPNFGQSVSIAENGTIVAVGAPSADESDTISGKARVYRYDGTAWMQYGTVIEGSEAGGSFGSSVSLSAGGEAVVVGSPGGASSDTAGHASVYHIQDDIWTLRATMNGTVPGDNMGYSVATSADGGLVVSGGPMANSDGRGYVRVEGYMESLA